MGSSKVHHGKGLSVHVFFLGFFVVCFFAQTKAFEIPPLYIPPYNNSEFIPNWELKRGTGEMDIALSCGTSLKLPMLALLKSIAHATDVNAVRIWAFAEEDDADKMEELYERYVYDKIYPKKNLRVMRYEKIPDLDAALGVSNHEKARFDHKREHLLARNSGNFVRFYMPQYFRDHLPQEERPKQFLYLDCDIVLLEDPRNLARDISHKLGKSTSLCMGAAERPESKRTHWGEGSKVLKKMGIPISTFHGLNAGVLYFDSECWIDDGSVDRILWWLKKNRATRVFNEGKVGSQVPLYFAFHPHHTTLEPKEGAEEYPTPHPYLVFDGKWNTKAKTVPDVNNASLIHFTGLQKPWHKNGFPVQKHLFSSFNFFEEKKETPNAP